jgi:hypothetical protein
MLGGEGNRALRRRLHLCDPHGAARDTRGRDHDRQLRGHHPLARIGRIPAGRHRLRQGGGAAVGGATGEHGGCRGRHRLRQGGGPDPVGAQRWAQPVEHQRWRDGARPVAHPRRGADGRRPGSTGQRRRLGRRHAETAAVRPGGVERRHVHGGGRRPHAGRRHRLVGAAAGSRDRQPEGGRGGAHQRRPRDGQYHQRAGVVLGAARRRRQLRRGDPVHVPGASAPGRGRRHHPHGPRRPGRDPARLAGRAARLDRAAQLDGARDPGVRAGDARADAGAGVLRPRRRRRSSRCWPCRG